jgi:pyruvate/2-oxoglutarate dehydrogenase complex dihydrolipoamide acyltransferase (E2) component
MTDVSLEVLNKRTVVAAVHAEAARIGADGDTLLDSATFFDRVTSLDPDSPGYRKQVQGMVAAAAGQATAPAQAAPARPAAPAGPRQWTMDDVDRSTPEEMTAALKAGLLRDMGVGAPRKRGRR